MKPAPREEERQRSQKKRKKIRNDLSEARVSTARTHMRRLGASGATNGIMVSPMGNFFTLHVITARGARL